MRKRWMLVVFDIAVLTGFGAYMAMTVWRLPEALRQRLLTSSLGMLARLTGIAG
jgi:hypothetical protein